MKKWLFGFMAGMAAGMVVAFANEDELDDAYYKACKCKKKLIRKMHQMDLEHYPRRYGVSLL